uniref:Doublecortin domain-containing protein 5-like n=1 Tax=Saccoglossus kowalevskii TaxID=10224 RepID=A0ABM0N0G4_SACKO|nr:PREDICTED: doublecortin domain-containing protein 5-like [Saccoglossus kowalevskii]
MMKDLNRTAMNGKRPLEKKKTNSDVDENTIETKESEKNLDLQKLEIQLFLDRCTSLLNLPFAARRIFDLEGNEQHTLHELQRDQLVYVSCGEIWTDPKLSKSEQQRRFLLANLTADVQQMTQYCTIRNPTNLVMEVDGPIQSGSRVIVNMCCMTKDERKAMEKESEEEPSQQDEPPEDPLGGLSETDQYSTHVSLASAHARAHVKSEERYENKKLPWERNSMNAGIDEVKDANDADGAQFTNPELYKKFQARPKSPSKRVSLQRFVYQDGFIAVESRPDLVLGSEDGELIECSEVVLCKKRIDDVNQRWVFSKSGLIHGKSNYDVVLGVACHITSTVMAVYQAHLKDSQSHYRSQIAKLGSANYKWTLITILVSLMPLLVRTLIKR